MTADTVRAIAEAVLYEGYLLWPYRRSALKNQQRFTFGGVYPEVFARASSDRSEVRMECLLETGERTNVELTARWLHLLERQPLRLERGEYAPVDELRVGEERHLAWEEAIERELTTGTRELSELTDGVSIPVYVPAGGELERLAADAALMRRWERLEGTLRVEAVAAAPGVVRLSARLSNDSGWGSSDRPGALKHSFLAAHFIARCVGGAFVSSTDPPEHLHAQACRNEGLWPVLVGEDGQRDVVLGSPIVLPDYPSVAPESPGNLFDGGEIDALLIHSIRALTDAEREEMRATDPHTAAILERSMALPAEELLRLYGAVRHMRKVAG